jgi:hypothetical protein
MAHLFKKNTATSVLANIEESIRVEDGVVSFKVNTGKGSAEQSLRVSDFRPVMAVLNEYAQGSIPREGAFSPVDIVRQTIHIDEEGMVSFRMDEGKGAKPVKVSLSDFSAVVGFLNECADQIDPVQTKKAKGSVEG